MVELRRRTRTTAVAALALAAVALAGCGGGDGPGAAPEPEPTVDWRARTATIEVPPPWRVAFCEGDAPMLCVARDREAAGAVELLDFHVATLPGFDGDLDAWADDFHRTIAADRRDGCGDGYEVRAGASERARVAGGEGLRYSFTATRDGEEVERTVGYAAVRDDVLYIVAAGAHDSGSCVGTEGGDFSPATLAAFEPTLAAVVAASRLPAPAGDGGMTGRLRDIDATGGLAIERATVLSGDEAVAAAREDGVIGPDEQLDSDFYVRPAGRPPVTLPIAPDAHVELYDCSSACVLRPVATAAFLEGTAPPYGGKDALFTFNLDDGVIVSVVEVYLP